MLPSVICPNWVQKENGKCSPFSSLPVQTTHFSFLRWSLHGSLQLLSESFTMVRVSFQCKIFQLPASSSPPHTPQYMHKILYFSIIQPHIIIIGFRGSFRWLQVALTYGKAIFTGISIFLTTVKPLHPTLIDALFFCFIDLESET